MRKASPLDLRIKSSAAFTCDLSTRVGTSATRGGSNATVYEDQPWVGVAERPWVRRIAYVIFAVAIALPWILFLADQIG